MQPSITDRIIAYLKRKNTWVSKDILYELAQSHGYHPLAIKDALHKVEKLVYIGYLYDKGYRYYDILPIEQAYMRRANEWWDTEDDTVLERPLEHYL